MIVINYNDLNVNINMNIMIFNWWS